MIRFEILITVCSVGFVLATDRQYEWHVSTDEPEQWLVRALEDSPALAQYRSIALDRNYDAAGNDHWTRSAAVRQLCDEIHDSPRPWEPDQHAEVASWLADAAERVRRYRAASPKSLTLDQAQREEISRGVVALPHVSFYYNLRCALVLELWRTDRPPEARVQSLSTLYALATDLAAGPTGPEVFLAARIYDDAVRSILALLSRELLTLDDLVPLLAHARWLEREDARSRAHEMITASLMRELAILDCLATLDSVERAQKIKKLNRELGALLEPDDVREAIRQDLTRLRHARIAFFSRLHQFLGRLGTLDHAGAIRTIDAVSVAEGGPPSLTQLIAPAGYASLLDAVLKNEVHRRGRMSVYELLLHQASFEPNEAGWYRKPLYHLQDPYSPDERLSIAGQDALLTVYSRGPDHADDGGDSTKDIILYTIDRSLLGQ